MYKNIYTIILVTSWLLISGCTVTVSHTPHEALKPLAGTVKFEQCLTVADLGDTRDNGTEDRDRAGFGVSYWLPVGYNLTDSSGKPLYVSQFIAESIIKDLRYLGYDAQLLNPQPNDKLTWEEALAKAKLSSCAYLVTSTVYDAKTNYWGFVIIPFVEPVWTRLGIDMQLIDLKHDTPAAPIKVEHRETEWYFAKITITDAIFDAGLFGRHWLQTAWGETVIPKGIAEGVLQLHNTINQNNHTAGARSTSALP
jgi:hypothetical protein